MSNKSVIQIEVQDESFKRFLDAFADYQAKLHETPEEWKKLEDAVGSAGNKFEGLSKETKEALSIAAASAGMVSAELIKATKAQGQFHASTVKSGGAMKKLADTAGDIGKTFFGMVGHLVKLGSLVGGLAGIGGMFGMDALANSAMKTERSSLGMGTSPGALRSFRNNAEQFFPNPDSILQTIFATKSSIATRFRIGQVLWPGAENLDTTEIAMRAAIKGHDPWQNKNNRSPELLEAQGYARLGFTPEVAERISKTPKSVLEQKLLEIRRDSSTFNTSQETNQQWIELDNSLKRAGTMIETTFINQLAKVAPELGKLSEEIGKDLSLLVGSIFTKDIVEALSAGIKDFSESLKSGEFKKGVKDFGQAIAGMAKGVIALAKSMGLITDPKTPEEQKEREEWEKKSPWEKFKASVLLDPNKVKKIAPKLLPSSSDGTDAPGVHIPHGMGAAGSIAWRHNNPGNLMFIGQLGASMGEPKKGGGHWARFASPELGWMAAVNDIRAKQRQGLTLAGLINKYAPSSENNTAEYIRKVASQLGVSPNTPASQISAVELAKKIVAYESGTGVTSHRFIKKTLKNAGHYDPLAKALADRYGSGPDIAETSRNAEDHISLLEKILKEHRKAAQQKKEGITINNNSSANVARSANALS